MTEQWKINMNRMELIKIIRANLESYSAAYLEAIQGLRGKAIKELGKAIRDIKAGKGVKRYYQFEDIEDHRDEYNRVLSMLDHSVDEVIEIRQSDYAKFALNEWDWMDRFKAQYSATTCKVFK